MQRVVRVLVSFVVMVTLYWVYALAAVPVLEPTAPVAIATKGDSTPPVPVESRYVGLLEKIFPAGSWQRDSETPPIVLEIDQAMLLVQKYENLPDGRLELKPCSMIFFTGGGEAGAQRGRPIVLDAPLGAKLRFEEGFDLAKARVGKLQAGELPGEIRIHSPATKSDANDAIEVLTRDVQLSQQRIWSEHIVTFEMGPNRGSGREMQILLGEDESGDKPEKKGAASAFGSIRSFELKREVQLQMLVGGGGGLLPSAGAETAAKPSASPVRIKCQGPFRFDALKSVATFSQRVDVERPNLNGPSDQMNCELLAVHFEPRATSTADEKARETKGALEPRLIEALGDPVIVLAPSSGATARGQRMEYDLKTRRMSIEGQREAELHQHTPQQTINVGARRLDYQPPRTGQLGRLYAVGPGWIQGKRRTQRDESFVARWAKTLSLQPDGKNHVMAMIGAAHVQSSSMGFMDADEIYLWLSETARRERSRGVIQPVAFSGRPARTEIRADRMLAIGPVVVDSPQLAAQTRRLEAWIEHKELQQPQQQQGAATAEPISAGPSASGPDRQPSRGRYQVAGGLIRVQLVSHETKSELAGALVEGNARLSEIKTANPDDKPLLVRGERVQLADAEHDQAKVAVVGKPAHVEARGMSLDGAKIQLEQATNRMWIEGPGQMRLPIDRDLNGRPTATKSNLDLTWQRGMNFNGRTGVFLGSIVGRTETQLLRTDYLEVLLNQQVEFGKRQTANQPIGIDRITCRDGAYLEQRVMGPTGLQSIDELQLKDLIVNLAPASSGQDAGALRGNGPGTIVSRRFGAPAQLPGAQPAAAPKTPQAPQLTYLYVQFARSLTGNVHRREMTFADQIKSVYGPIADWDQKLSLTDVNALGNEGALLSCDQLTVRESPAPAVQGAQSAELIAQGNTFVEGRTFTARADRMSYAQGKGLLILEGIGRNKVELNRQAQPGGPITKTVGDRFWYWPATQQIAGDLRSIDSGVQPAGKR